MASVIVLAGGNSTERDVSFRTGAAVANALKEAGHTVTMLDPAEGLSKEKLECDVVFPALHGEGGEDGSLQRQLDEFGIPYVGSEVEASELCFDKQRYKDFLGEHNISTPAGAMVSEEEFWKSPLIENGYVLKPVDGGSSIDIILHRKDSERPSGTIIKDLFNRYKKMLLEELVEGTEITVAVFDSVVMPVIEIIPPNDGWFDYENKYNGQTQELCPPINVDETTQEAAQDLALQIDKLCGCRDMSRTDMILDSAKKLWVLETNTIPGMTDQSLLPVAIRTIGISYPEMVDRLVKAALSR